MLHAEKYSWKSCPAVELNAIELNAIEQQVVVNVRIFYKFSEIFRRVFFNFHYFSTFASIAVGVVSCLLRIVKSFAFGVWTVPRLDQSTLNRYFERFDPGINRIDKS